MRPHLELLACHHDLANEGPDIVAADLCIVRIAQFPTDNLGKTSNLIRCNPRVPGADLTVEPDDFLIDRSVREFVYTYDISDDWWHTITLETIGPGETDFKYPRFVDGERRCPLEDVGGLRGFEMFLDAMAYPAHDEYDYLHDWYDGPCNADDIDERFTRRPAGELAYQKSRAQ